MNFNRIKTFAGTAAAAVIMGLFGVNAFAQTDDPQTEYVLSSQINEYREDSQYPRYETEHTTLRNAALNLTATGKLFGVSIPLHNARFSNYNKSIAIDVSKWNGEIDWAKVKAQGVNYAFIRVGYRGYSSSGTIVLDSSFKENIENAIANDVKVGVYFFTQAISKAEAVKEAEFVISQIKSYDIKLPVVIDIEDSMVAQGDTSRVDDAKLTRQQFTDICKGFCDTVEAAGYVPMIYANANWLNTILYTDQLENNYSIWLANYVNKTTYTGQYDYWQYSCEGVMTGVEEDVDLNIVYLPPLTCPQNVTSSVSSSGKTVLSWDRMKSADGYEIYRLTETSDGIAYKKIGSAESCSYTLNSGDYDSGGVNTYAIRSYQLWDGAYTYSEFTQDIAVNSVYSKIDGLTASGFSSSSVTLSWNALSGAGAYRVYVQKDSDEAFTLYSTVTSTSCKITGLSSSTRYNFKVCAEIPKNGKTLLSPFSETFYAATATQTPTNLAATQKTESSLTVTWSADSGANIYYIYNYDTSTKKYTRLCTSTANSVTISDLSAGKKYNICVISAIKLDSGVYKSGISQKLSVCTKPLSLESISSVSYEKSIRLSWKSCGEDVKYLVYSYDMTTKKYTLLTTTSACSFTHTGLSPKTKYAYKIRVRGSDNTDGGFCPMHYTYTSVGTVTNLKISKKGSDYLTLGWDKVTSATAYGIYVTNLSTGKYQLYATTSANTYTISDIPPGKPYTICVRAYATLEGKNYFGGLSNVVTAAVAPSAVQNLTFDHTGAKENTVALSWTKQSYVTGYQVYRYDSAEKKYVYVTTSATNSVTAQLESGTDYIFRVRAFTRVGGVNYYGGFSSACQAFTRSSAPENISLKSNTASSVTLSWDTPAGAVGYDVYSYNSSTQKYTYLGTTTNTYFTVSGLNAGTTFRFAVKSYKIWGKAVWYSGYSDIFATGTRPAQTTAKIAAVSSSAVKISWSKVSGAVGYVVEQYKDGKWVTAQNISTPKNTVTEYIVTNLNGKTSYKFRVRAYKKVGTSTFYGAYSPVITATTK